jgi:hypothetical protein
MYKLLFLLFVPVCGGQMQVSSFDGEKLDEIFSRYRNALNESFEKIETARREGDIVEMFRSAIMVDEHLKRLVILQEDCRELALLLRSRAEREYKGNKIGRDEYFNLLALADRLNKHSKFSFDPAQRQLRKVIKMLEKMDGRMAANRGMGTSVFCCFSF